jgi:hypothetical protein
MRTTQKKTMLWKRLANAQAFQPPNGQKHLVCTKTPSNRQKEKYQNSRTSSREKWKKKKGERRVCRS